MPKKRPSVGHTIGGIVAGIEQQIFRTTPPAHELVAKGTPLRPVAAAGGGTISVGMPADPVVSDPSPDDPVVSDPVASDPERLHLRAPGVEVVVDLVSGGRLASFVVDGHELLLTEGPGPMGWGSFPMAPYAGRIRDGQFEFRGRRHELPIAMPPHAIHGTVFDRPWRAVDGRTITIDLGPSWPFAGRAVQRFELTAGRFTSRLEVRADEPMPASIGWHPWFRRRPRPVAGAPSRTPIEPVELVLDAGAMLRRDPAGITTTELVSPPPPGPWDDCFTDLGRPPMLRWPGFLELTIESDCSTWVVYTMPADALCVEPQTAPPDALNARPAIIEPGRPLTAEMTWTWRSLSD
ncbi:MAG: aldose 1-epimerase [Chloroflexota bacterium]